MKKLMFLVIFLFLNFSQFLFADEVNWRSVGPGAGSFLMSIAFQPDNADIIYAGGDIEGVYKSTDGGETWSLHNIGIKGGNRPAGSYATQELVIDPNNFNRIYACTWNGLFRSNDGADNWEFIFPFVKNFPFDFEDEIPPISYIAIDENNSDTLYAGVGNADCNEDGTGMLFRSVDSGENWDLIDVGMDSETVIHGIVIDPLSPVENRRIFLSTNDGIYKSDDNGNSWVSVNNGLPHKDARRISYRIVDNSLKLYLTIKTEGDNDDLDSFEGGIYESVDGGNSWESINGDLPKRAEDPEAPLYDYWKFTVHPTNSNIIYIGSNLGGWADSWGVHKTTNGGENWIKVDPDEKIGLGWLDKWWNDRNVTILELAPSDPEIIIAGSDFIHKSSNSGDTWQQIYTEHINGTSWKGRGIELMEPFGIGFGHDNSDVMYIGYDDFGFWRSDDNGNSFKRLDEKVESVLDCPRSIVVDPVTGDIYAGRSGGDDDDFQLNNVFSVGEVWKSSDKGESWNRTGSPETGLPSGKPALALDITSPVDSRIIYCGVYGQGVYKSLDSGKSWISVNKGLDNKKYVWTIELSASDPETLYAGLNSIFEEDGSGLYKSVNSGEDWIKLGNLPNGDVFDIAIDPVDKEIVYVAITNSYDWSVEGGVFKSENGGETWVKVFDQPRIGFIKIHPNANDVIFAGVQSWWNFTPDMDSGVYRSNDKGNNWENITSNLGHTFILEAEINPHNSDQLFVTTHGAGVWIGDGILSTIKAATPTPAPSVTATPLTEDTPTPEPNATITPVFTSTPIERPISTPEDNDDDDSEDDDKSFTFRCGKELDSGSVRLERLILELGDNENCTVKLTNLTPGKHIEVSTLHRKGYKSAIKVNPVKGITDSNGEMEFSISAIEKGRDWIAWAIANDKGEFVFNKNAYNTGLAWGMFVEVQ